MTMTTSDQDAKEAIMTRTGGEVLAQLRVRTLLLLLLLRVTLMLLLLQQLLMQELR